MNKKSPSVKALEELGRERLSHSFYLRDFMHSEIAAVHGLVNVPVDHALAIEAGRKLCTELLEPLNATFGRIAVRSGYRSPEVNDLGNQLKLNCASNENNRAAHIWDLRDADGHMGATACVVVPWFADRFAQGAPWQSLAWWIHDHLPYSDVTFFPKLAAFNIRWHERPKRIINSYIAPKGCLTRPGMPNHDGDHASEYAGFPSFQKAHRV